MAGTGVIGILITFVGGPILIAVLAADSYTHLTLPTT